MGKGAPDVLVAGAGAYGLAAALACARRGMSVLVVEAAAPGAGASGGPVGALAPHAPHPWTPAKAAQARMLADAAAFWAGVAAEGGVDPGYARLGRATPLASAAARARAEAAAGAAAEAPEAAWTLHPPDALPGWIAPEAAPFGLARDSLTARLTPPRAIAALAAALRAHGGEIRTGWRAAAAEDGALRAGPDRLTAGTVILATGAAPLPGLPALIGAAIGAAPGQAALLAAAAPPGAPLIAADGLWIVPQPGGVAVGSTADPAGPSPAAPSNAPPAAALDAVIARARALCPALAGAPVLARWSGQRPRAARPDPLLARLSPRLILATGGFRTGLATAPMAGALAAAMAAGEFPDLPPGWSLAEHRATATKSR